MVFLGVVLQFIDYSFVLGLLQVFLQQVLCYDFLMLGFDEFGGSNDVMVQVEYMVLNYLMFVDGMMLFIGDYVDVVVLNLFFDESIGWCFVSQFGDVVVWQVVWVDNCDVVFLFDGDWGKYVVFVGVVEFF